MIKTDFLVIGSGIAGLSYALKVANHFKNSNVILVTKTEKGESNTKYAQGGIATVVNTDIDSFEQHIQDTLTAGDGLCDPSVV
ncbi:MAG: FAD-binding protein, partial [Wenyingzhuangia sp.]